MIPPRKRSPAPKAAELEFDTTQEIDPALAASLRAGHNTTLKHSDFDDFDDTEILLDAGAPAQPAPRRR